MTEDVSAGGASENFLTRFEEAIKKNCYSEIISRIHTGPSGQKPQKIFWTGQKCDCPRVPLSAKTDLNQGTNLNQYFSFNVAYYIIGLTSICA